MIFNRPNQTYLVFEQIRKIKPKYLFIAADGPRSEHVDDVKKCAETRSLVTTRIDWDCEVKTLFRDQNLGCDKAPAEAITWFFDQIEYGIILEDDCLPSVTFFTFCEDLLKRYSNEDRIMMISGFNALGKWHEESIDYFYTEGSIWGWASWRRAWSKFDFRMNNYNQLIHKRYVNGLIENDYPGFTMEYERILKNELDAWDYQWHYARKSNNGLSITPSLNLIQNIGFGNDATHTTWEFNPFNGIEANERENELRYNDVFIPDNIYRQRVQEYEKVDKKNNMANRILNRIKRVLIFLIK